MPKYIPKLLQCFKHKAPIHPHHSPYQSPPKTYGAAAEDHMPINTTNNLNKLRIKNIQRIVGAILYYARAVDHTVLTALSSVAGDQANATEQTEHQYQQLLDYLTTHPCATIRYYASDMIFNIHYDASYLSEVRARSRTAGHFFLGSVPSKYNPIPLNGEIYVHSGILKFVVASAAEAELGALFLNTEEGKILRTILEELGHAQPPTPINCDNLTAVGIANDTVKKQRSRSMEMRFFWITDQVRQGYFDVQWHRGQENLADYFTKHFDRRHHQEVRPWYLHMHNSPRFLPLAAKPSTLKRCVGTFPN